ncbi:MAG: preprotein translocase subunit SecE [Acidimicrobiia bacterium]|nr:preprotein translocase subunit SecE [Acidimicrobiia bacterium]
MNRETRRLQQREERRQKKADEARQESSGKSPVQRAAQRRPAAVERKPFFKRIYTFLREVRAELKRVSWPTRDQMVAFTTVTVITTVALTALTFVMDFGFKNGIIKLLELGS